MDTIFALATPLGGAIAIIRISGEQTRPILRELFSGEISHSKITHGKLVYNSQNLDDCMAVFFCNPHSYTGEDMAELYIHSSLVIASSVCEALTGLGARTAQAGEFTKRAFMNGKLDLIQSEAVCDLINASAKRQQSAALMQLNGELSHEIAHIEEMLTDVAASIGAVIDFPDETKDLPVRFDDLLETISSKLTYLINSGLRSKCIRDGCIIAIVGRPNVGKSSLLNALLMQNRAIVTDIAGTTRDVIDADTIFDNLPIKLYDTAGLHESCDDIEVAGMSRTRDLLLGADICFVAFDASVPLSTDDINILNELLDCQTNYIIVGCKADLTTPQRQDEFKVEIYNLGVSVEHDVIFVSSKTGEGIDELKHYTAKSVCPSDESGLITNTRHIQALARARDAVESAKTAFEIDCISTDISNALHAMGEITGNAVDQDVITRIFERFCVGK